MFRKIIRSLIITLTILICSVCYSSSFSSVKVVDTTFENSKIVMWLPKLDEELEYWLKNDSKNK